MPNDIYYVSQHWLNKNHAGHSLLYDLVCLFDAYGFKSLLCTKNKSKLVGQFPFNKLVKPYVLETDTVSIKNATLILTAYNPHFLRSLQCFPELRERFSTIIVYLLDTFDPNHLGKTEIHILKNVDHVFTIMDDSIDHFKRMGVHPVHILPFGIDALRYAVHDYNKKIDLFSFGRVDERYHDAIESAFVSEKSDKLYVYSTIPSGLIVSQKKHRRLHWKLLTSSRLSFCFEPSSVKRFYNRSPVLYRWYECYAAGVVPVGTRPKCASEKELLNWEDSTIVVPEDPLHTKEFIDALLSDTKRLSKASLEGRYQALSRHDWRYRFKHLLDIAGVKLPKKLVEDLASLDKAKQRLR